MRSLHAKATPNPEYLVPPPPVLSDPRAVYDRLMGLASLARALNPDLPPNLRFYRRAEAAEDTRNNASFGVVFTSEANAIGMAQESEVEFWSALEAVLPAHVLAGERANLDAAPSYKFSSAIDAAVYGAHRDGLMKVATAKSGDPDWVIQSTNGKRIPEMDFLSEPSLSRWLYLTPSAKIDADARLSPGLVRSRNHVRTMMDILSKPFDDCSADEKARVAQSFQALEEKRRDSFEFNHQHGWIGYAFAHGAAGWTAPLLKLGASAHIPYNGELPVVWATALDDGYSVGALVQAGASVLTLLSGAPKVYDAQNQARLESQMGPFSSLLGLAATVGAPRATAVLCQKGANVLTADARGATPLHVACRQNNEPLVRVLISNGADLSVEDRDNLIPSECIPFDGESMFNWMEQIRLGGVDAKVKSAPSLNIQRARLPWEDEDLGLKNRSRKLGR